MESFSTCGWWNFWRRSNFKAFGGSNRRGDCWGAPSRDDSYVRSPKYYFTLLARCLYEERFTFLSHFVCMYYSNDACSLSISLTWDTHILVWFSWSIWNVVRGIIHERYPFNFNFHIMFSVNGVSHVLILSIFHDIVPQLFILIFYSYLIAWLELLWWLQWKYDYT